MTRYYINLLNDDNKGGNICVFYCCFVFCNSFGCDLKMCFVFIDPLMELIKIQEVSLGNYIPHPVCVSGLALTSLRTEKFGKVPLSL